MKVQLTPPSFPPKKLILFDLDGVLWDSRENMAQSWAEVRTELGVTVSFESYFQHIGAPFGDIMTQLGLARRATEIETVFRVASMKHMDMASFYSGVEFLLERLERGGAKLGIITSKDELRTSAILAMLPVTFDIVRTPDAFTRGKPAPDHLLTAMAYAAIDPVDTVYVGDMDSDFEAARRAQIDYAHASWGYGDVPAGCTTVLRDLKEVERFVSTPPFVGRVAE